MPDGESVMQALKDSLRNQHCGFIENVGNVYAVSEETINDALKLLEYGDHNAEVLQVNSWEDEYYGTVALCPKCKCKWMMGNGDDLNFCPKCGQAVKWE